MINRKFKLDLGRVFLIGTLCMLACCGDGDGCGTGGPCQHPWNGLPGSCAISDAQPLGTVGGLCHSSTSGTGELCDPGARCDDGVCIACGTAGGTCCDPGPGGGEAAKCPDGSTCTETGDFGTCDATCGTLTPGTDTCCAGDNCGVNLCNINTGKCMAGTSGLCADPTLPATKVTYLDSNKCAVTTITIHASTTAERDQCIQSIAMAHGWSSCAPNDLPVPDNFCGSTNMWGDHEHIANICTTESGSDVEQCKLASCGENCMLEPDDSCP